MALHAVIFDYGMVLTGLPDPTAHAELLRITGLPAARFDSLYWVDRHAYDEGKLTGLAFWQKLIRDGGLHLPPGAAEELNEWDARLWTTENPPMLAWQEKLRQHGFLTGILSNMGDNVLVSIERTFDWLPRFDVLVWSYKLGMAKPDPAIYRHILKQLAVAPEEALFIDDKLENILAARKLGMKAIQFSNVDQLRLDLVSAGLDAELPLP